MLSHRSNKTEWIHPRNRICVFFSVLLRFLFLRIAFPPDAISIRLSVCVWWIDHRVTQWLINYWPIVRGHCFDQRRRASIDEKIPNQKSHRKIFNGFLIPVGALIVCGSVFICFFSIFFHFVVFFLSKFIQTQPHSNANHSKCHQNNK